ncbi:MAG: hypothetical protein NC820_01725 [Candidatus Omnitrophica bacterium]|nr:hypothetical protein [Candidatus Omnitrophota bacterium]
MIFLERDKNCFYNFNLFFPFLFNPTYIKNKILIKKFEAQKFYRNLGRLVVDIQILDFGFYVFLLISLPKPGHFYSRLAHRYIIWRPGCFLLPKPIGFIYQEGGER